MPAKKAPSTAPTRKTTPAAQPSMHDRVEDAVATLKRLGSKRGRDDMARRYNITGPSAEKAFGTPMSQIKALGKRLGKDHDLATALWENGNYEARMLVSFIGDPDRLTPAQMDRWVDVFDNWAYCDALCFNLFDRSPHAFTKVKKWAASKDEFTKRTAFALLWSLALHDKASGDAPFLACLPLVERAAGDDRNFVKKAVSMALKAVGRRSPVLQAASLALAGRLADSPSPAARWVGRDAVKTLQER